MGEWLKKRLQALEGNVVYSLLFAAALYMVALGPVVVFRAWLHRPVTNLGMACWSFTPVLIGLVALLVYRYSKPKIHILVTSSTNGAGSVYQHLIVQNLGSAASFRAECEIVEGHYLVNGFRTGRFRLGWDEGTDITLLLPHEATGKLLISEYKSIDKAGPLSAIRFLECSGGKSIEHTSGPWNEHPHELLPRFVFDVFLFADKVDKPCVKRYRLFPKRYSGPLVLEEVLHES